VAECAADSDLDARADRDVRLWGRVPEGAAGMTPEYRLERITETIRAIKIGVPLSKTLVALLLDPWPDLYREARDREGEGWINLLQAAAARIERDLE